MSHAPHPVVQHAPFPFPDGRFPRNLGAVVQRTVAEGHLPALVVIHDDEGDWLIGDGVNDPNLPDASGIYCISCIAEHDPSVSETADLQPGSAAHRDGPGLPWTVRPFSYEDDED
ncbi:hypothetical protein ACFVGM_15935 [Kitasatospora purpeofusca]|uniref:hypothetical protein n=1 Tax=Kitasatospora purpeofusca TaxID=67352 RepID=UPI0036C74CFD